MESVSKALPFTKVFFFTDLEPRLVKVAQRFRVSDPEGEAASWWELFSKIYDSVDSNPQHSIFIDRETGLVITDKDKISSNLIGYMLTSFKNELLHEIKVAGRFVSSPARRHSSERLR